MRKPLLALSLVLLLVMAQLIASAPTRKSLRAQLNPNYVRAMAAYKRLQSKLPREELRAITTIGILNGAKQVEEQMERHLIDVVQDLVLHTDIQDTEAVAPKITQIEQQLQRNQHALQILTSAMGLATHSKDVQAFRQELQQMRQQTEAEAPPKLEQNAAQQEHDIGERVTVLRQNILQQVNTMKEMVEQKIEHTLDYLIEAANEDGLLAKASRKVLHKRDTSSSREEPADVRMIKSILTEHDFRHNLIDERLAKRKDDLQSLDSLEDNFDLDANKEIANRSDRANKSRNGSSAQIITTTTTTTSTDQPKLAKQEVEADSAEVMLVTEPADSEAPPAGGGLVGIIASLSGGEGGSDVGALLGSLTGLVGTLFGPGGLDIESLISTGTSLLSGLLSGDKNFGTVLGTYVGTAFDGLSGGGGAVNNGKFIGNFLGTVVASLSADPEDDDEPPKPFIFAQNLFHTFMEAKNRKPDAETEERHDQTGGKGGMGGKGDGAEAAGCGGSDSGGFIKQIVSHLVSSAVTLLLNASVGASGGASHAAHSLLSTSSSHSKPAAPAAAHGTKSWY